MVGLLVCNALNLVHWLFCSFLHCVKSTFVPHLSHLRQQTPQLRGCSFCWGQRMAMRNTSPMPCSPSWTKSASGRVRTQNGKRQPGTLLHVATCCVNLGLTACCYQRAVVIEMCSFTVNYKVINWFLATIEQHIKVEGPRPLSTNTIMLCDVKITLLCVFLCFSQTKN